ncbi:MAG: GNAT family N-acetyltransferase [Rhizobiales bacterium]|nr:GNAT family N-acetyltransferase [Hyphomicrobiales bacterium]MBO6699757.1 GNAT family N-acetyltransferase [Hyphomicrobiales bacterium]MBO6737295.1 GNAT family N-acetyltransferase [Hyphomicrobiales bacterium]MBO6911631.1 GNAT family N-acetyltransferase [Hyphomicrobiales bacterium]MBO6954947.1 GNAT family N-acetyltransferase [Hyphomicrobiales bacterium]
MASAGKPDLPHGYDWLAANAVERNLFFEPAMIEPALRHLASDGVELCVATDPEFAIPRAAMPVVRARGRYGPVPTPSPLMVWHHPYSMVGTPLISPEEPEKALDALFAKAARRQDGPPVLLMQMVLADGPAWPLIQSVVEKSCRRLHVLESTPRAGLRLDAEATHAATLRTILGGKRLQSVKASRRKLKTEGELVHRIATSGEDLRDALSRFLALEASGWKGRMGTALSSRGHDSYARSVAENLSNDGRVRIDLSCLEGANGPDRPLGGALSIKAGTQDAPIWMPWKVAYDEQFVRAGPGVLTLANLTESLLGDCQKADQPLLIDSLASPDSQLAPKLWRDHLTLVDVVIDLKPGGSGAFGPILLAEKARKSAFVAGKAARGAIKRAAKQAQAALKR